MIERCSCGALIVALRRSVVLAWRAEHLHDFGDEGGAGGHPGYVHESSSQAERAWPDFVVDTVSRPPVGFARV